MLHRLLLVASLLTATASGAESWRLYTNDRFGISVEVPASFRPQAPPANDDGRTFASADGHALIQVYGSYAPSVVVESFSAYRSWTRTQTLEEGLSLSYDAAGKDWFALSGSRGDRIVYLKVVAACRDRSLAQHLRIEHPAADKARWDPVVTRVSRSLRHVGVAGC